MTVVKEGEITITYRLKGASQQAVIEGLVDITRELTRVMNKRFESRAHKTKLVFWRYE